MRSFIPRLSNRPRPVALLLLTLMSCLLTSCKENGVLTDAVTFAQVSADARTTGNNLIDDYVSSCERITARQLLFDAVFLQVAPKSPAEVADQQKTDCQTQIATSQADKARLRILFDYFDSMAGLANYKPATVDSSGAFAAAGVNKADSASYSALLDAIDKLATSHARYEALRTVVPDTNPALQHVLSDLRVFYAPPCDLTLHTATMQLALYVEDNAAFSLLQQIVRSVNGRSIGPNVLPLCVAGVADTPSALKGAKAIAPAPVTMIRTMADLVSFRTLIEDYAATLATTDKVRQAATQYDRALLDIAIAHQTIVNRLHNLPDPCPLPKVAAHAPAPGDSIPTPKPTPVCQPLDKTAVILYPPQPTDLVSYQEPGMRDITNYLEDAQHALRSARVVLAGVAHGNGF